MKIKTYFLALFFSQVLIAQTSLHYDIISNSFKIGDLYVSKSQNGNEIIYQSKSKTEVKLFVKVELSYNLDAIYKNNQLVFSSVSTYLNGKLHTNTTAEKNKNSYILVSNKHQNRLFKTITYSGVKLYFNEPKNITFVFSEFYNGFNPIKKIANNTYLLTNIENGNTSEYYYQKGILKKAIIHHTLMTFSLILNNTDA